MSKWYIEDEELEVMDPLKALSQNADRLDQIKEAKVHLVEMALQQGYSYKEIGDAIGQTDQAIRMFRKRNA